MYFKTETAKVPLQEVNLTVDVQLRNDKNASIPVQRRSIWVTCDIAIPIKVGRRE